MPYYNYVTPIESGMRANEQCHFQRSWVTSQHCSTTSNNLKLVHGIVGFNVPLDTLKTCTRYSYTYNDRLTRNCTPSIKWYHQLEQELSYRIQIARQLRTQYVEGINRPKYYTVTLKSRLKFTQGHWKWNHWIDHTRLTIGRAIWRWILSWPKNVGYRSFKVIESGTIWKFGYDFLFAFHRIYGRIFSHFGDIQPERMTWP